MTRETIFALLKDVQQGGIGPENALRRLADLPIEDAEFAKRLISWFGASQWDMRCC